MQAKIYYQTIRDGALPICFLSKGEVADGLGTLLPHERNILGAQQFKGRLGDIASIYNAEGFLSKLYIGSGNGMEETTAIAYAATKIPSGHYFFEQALSIPSQVMWSLAQYRFEYYKKSTRSPRILTISDSDEADILAEADAIFLVRDLINIPANDMGPRQLAEVVANLAKKFNAEFKQWIGQELLSDNFPAIHAVGRAAHAEPRLLSFTWGNPIHPKVTLVGKGVCFDTGGLVIKPAAGMRLMKKDMGGAAQILGLAQWLMTKRLPIRLQVWIPAVENSISGEAFRPGDVLETRKGLRVEIENTDAEGRLVLADALTKACEESPELLLDFATLTSSARVAVGTELSALFTNNEALAQMLIEIGAEMGDPMCRLPLYEPYASLLDSNIADLTNSSSSPYAGAIVAALFLKRFIQEPVEWAHFDIMAWNTSNKPGRPEGGEAMGIKTVGHYLLRRYG